MIHMVIKHGDKSLLTYLIRITYLGIRDALALAASANDSKALKRTFLGATAAPRVEGTSGRRRITHDYTHQIMGNPVAFHCMDRGIPWHSSFFV